MTEPRKPRAGTRGRPFKPGNPGRVPGSRNRATIAAEALLDGEAGAITRKAIEMALEGDTVALRLCMERLVPPRKERPVAIELPTITDAADHPAVIARIFDSVASGDLTASEAQALSSVLEQHRRAVETTEIIERLNALETRDADPLQPHSSAH